MIYDWSNIKIGDAVWWYSSNTPFRTYRVCSIREVKIADIFDDNILAYVFDLDDNKNVVVVLDKSSEFIYSTLNEAKEKYKSEKFPRKGLLGVSLSRVISFLEGKEELEKTKSCLTLSSLEVSLNKLVSPELKEALMFELRKEYEQ